MNYFQQKESGTSLLEWSLLRNWMKDWLRYVHWYWSVANSPDVSLSYFFSASVYEKEWRIRRESSELILFGLLWKIYDLVAEKGVAWSPPMSSRTPPWISGMVTRRSLWHGFFSRA